jgi:nucleotidyltransferase substrate binding protein (TIGR01987 family)
MERLKERVEIAGRALKTFAELTQVKEPSKIERDAMIQRFEYSFEAIWKAVKRYLYIIEGIEANSPKSTIRASFELMLLDESQAKQAMVMADDRNLTSHTYNEGLADELLLRMKEHEEVLTSWLSEVKRRVDKN